MTNVKTIRQNIVAAMAAFAVSSACILGTVGPVQANSPAPIVETLAA
jgi:hypothetical protein